MLEFATQVFITLGILTVISLIGAGLAWLARKLGVKINGD